MGRLYSLIMSFLLLAFLLGCSGNDRPEARVAAKTGDPAKQSDRPVDLPAQERAIAQDPEAAVKQFDELKKQLPKITEGDLTKTQEIYKSVKGRLELARMYGPNEAKVTVVFHTDLGLGATLNHLTIHLRYFRGKWTTTDYDCSWSKVGSGTDTEAPWRNRVALGIMLKIDKLADKE